MQPTDQTQRPTAAQIREHLVMQAPRPLLQMFAAYLGAEALEQECEEIYQVAKRLIAEIEKQKV